MTRSSQRYPENPLVRNSAPYMPTPFRTVLQSDVILSPVEVLSYEFLMKRGPIDC